MSTQESREHHEALYQHGQTCRQKLLTLLKDWPEGELCMRVGFGIRTQNDQQLIRTALEETITWIKAVGDYQSVQDRRQVKDIIRRLTLATLEEDYYRLNGVDEASMAIQEAFLLLRRTPSTANIIQLTDRSSSLPVIVDVFIVMSMNSDPEIEDAYEAIKSGCQVCGFHGVRADDIRHSGLVINVVLNLLRTCRFVIVDLTWGSSNVFWEAGVAHGANKEVILVCKKGTNLPFDLAGNNILEYRSFSELKRMIIDRLQAIPNAA
jgi:hypothetical protein